MNRIRAGELAYYRFESFGVAQVSHGVFTRLGGVSAAPFASLNLGHTVGDDSACVEANHRAIYGALGISAEDVVTVHQVHSDRVVRVAPGDGGKCYPEADALISNVPSLYLLLRFADCVPILLYAPRQQAVGLAHAGWQGTLKGIAAKAARSMISAYGCAPGEIYAGIGPAIGPCCFEVGPEVVDLVHATQSHGDALLSRQQPDGKAHLDLWRANAAQLAEVGIEHIAMADLCTHCRCDEFYSHRGEHGHTGRFGVLIGLRGN
jgi:polyphenol oxidase